MGLTVCSRIYGPNVRVSEKSNNYHKDIYGLYYCKDNKMFYTSAGEPYLNVFRMQDVDLSSLEIIGENYAKDKDHVYYQNKILTEWIRLPFVQTVLISPQMAPICILGQPYLKE